MTDAIKACEVIVQPVFDALAEIERTGRPLVLNEPLKWEPSADEAPCAVTNRIISVKSNLLPLVEELQAKAGREASSPGCRVFLTDRLTIAALCSLQAFYSPEDSFQIVAQEVDRRVQPTDLLLKCYLRFPTDRQ